MNEQVTANERISFIAYTVLGYATLLLHHMLFGPELAKEPTAFRAVLVFLNLGLGTWFFIRALCGLWKIEKGAREGV